MITKQQPPPRKQRRGERGSEPSASEQRPAEYGGPKGLEPTRYGDWERNGRCSDF